MATLNSQCCVLSKLELPGLVAPMYVIVHSILQGQRVAVSVHGYSFMVKWGNTCRVPTSPFDKFVSYLPHGCSFTRLGYNKVYNSRPVKYPVTGALVVPFPAPFMGVTWNSYTALVLVPL